MAKGVYIEDEESIGADKGDGDGDGAGENNSDELSVTLMASFWPDKQWLPTVQMKWSCPISWRGILAGASEITEIVLLVSHVSNAVLSTKPTVWTPLKKLNTVNQP